MTLAPTHPASPLPQRPLAIVTGGAVRLGRAIALELARKGCDIAVHYNTSAGPAQAACAELAALGADARAFGFDLSDADAIAAGYARIREAFGRAPVVLVNSASIFEWDDITTVTAAAMARHHAINTIAPVVLTRLVADGAGTEARGMVVNITDMKLAAPYPDHLSYTLTKYALAGFTELAARALAPRFRVNAVAPGHSLPGPGESDAHFEALHDQTPLARGPTPEDIAGAVGYLFSAPAVTGQTLVVDGGAYLRPQARDVMFREA